jgi:hypothetical protein
MLLPIAPSFVEGCAQSPRYNVKHWNTGVLEWWNNGVMHLKPSTPILPYSNTPFSSYASEIFLSSLQTEFFSNVFSGPFTLSLSKGERSDRRKSTVTIR